MEALRVRVLGPFQVDGRSSAAVGTRKARTLVKLLALGRGLPVPVDRIVDVLWGDAPPARANDQVAVLASRLRGTLGRDRVTFGDGGYALVADWLDLDAFDALARDATVRLDAGDAAGAATAAGAALELVRGALLADETDAPWADADRVATERAVVRVRAVAAHAALATGDAPTAATFAQQSLDADPYDEDALRVLMRAYVAAGRPANALAAYAQARERLADDLGASPAAETEALHTAIVREEPLGDAPGTTTPALVGRDAELAALDAAARLARAGVPQVVLVTGDAGIGKSTLLAAWAERAEGAGAVVLRGATDELARSLPLQPLVDAIDRYQRATTTDVLTADDAALLGPLLGRGGTSAPLLADGLVGPAALYGALADLLARIGADRLVALLLDDVHLAGPAIGEWLAFVRRRSFPLAVVVAARSGEPVAVAPDTTIAVPPLDLDAVTAIVGDERAGRLYERSGGNPLFLGQLAAASPDDELPATVRAAVSQRCVRLGADVATTLRAAAVLGRTIDLDLLAAVTRTDPVTLLAHLEAGARHGLLDESGDGLWFHHDLVREALAAETNATRAALLHREAARALVASGTADPLDVAYHARLGGDTDTAAAAFAAAAGIASARFDHASAEHLLDQALALRDDAPTRVARARARVMRAEYADAVDDVERALEAGAGADALETAGWATYFARDLDAAKRYADDGVRLATDDATRGRCLALAGRVRHGQGELGAAEQLLQQAATTAEGPDQVVAAAWLGVLRSHQSRTEDALALLLPATRVATGRETSALLNALMFGGHALALAGEPAAAIELWDRYEREAGSRQATRFVGRGDNFASWALRSLGAPGAATERNEIALDAEPTVETFVAAHQDLADGALRAGDLDAARAHLGLTATGCDGDTVIFGWRLRLKQRWLAARLAFAEERFDETAHDAGLLAADAEAMGIPRYALPARVLAARAGAKSGDGVDLAAVEHDLERLHDVVAIEAWWLTGEAARDLGVAPWFERAARHVDALAARAGGHAESLRDAARRDLAAWRDVARV